MLAIHGANPIQPPYQSREHLFSTDLNDLFGFDEWLKEVKNSVSKSYPSVIAHWFLFVYDKKEKIFIPRMVLMHETGIVTCYSKENAVSSWMSCDYSLTHSLFVMDFHDQNYETSQTVMYNYDETHTHQLLSITERSI